MLSVTKIVKFDAAHYLPQHEGKCNRLHGHTWKVEVEITRRHHMILGDEGMVVDFSKLKELLQNYVLIHVDHQCLNDSPFKILQNPTAEHLCIWIMDQIRERVKNLTKQNLEVVRVRVWESEDSYAEWREKG